MDPNYAACTLDCTKCEAYIATQANDQQAKESILAKWRVAFNVPDMPVEAVTCDGCMTGERHGGYCLDCGVRKCALERGLPTCAHCPDYACDTISAFFKMAPDLKAQIEAMRKEVFS